MSDVDQLSLLAVGVSGLVESSPEIDVRYAVSAQETIAILRLMSFDLLLAGKKIPDCTVWSLIKRVRAGWPGQRWALVAEEPTPQEEIQARTLGALMVLHSLPDRVRLFGLASAVWRPRPLEVESK